MSPEIGVAASRGDAARRLPPGVLMADQTAQFPDHKEDNREILIVFAPAAKFEVDLWCNSNW